MWAERETDTELTSESREDTMSSRRSLRLVCGKEMIVNDKYIAFCICSNYYNSVELYYYIHVL